MYTHTVDYKLQKNLMESFGDDLYVRVSAMSDVFVRCMCVCVSPCCVDYSWMPVHHLERSFLLYLYKDNAVSVTKYL